MKKYTNAYFITQICIMKKFFTKKNYLTISLQPAATSPVQRSILCPELNLTDLWFLTTAYPPDSNTSGSSTLRPEHFLKDINPVLLSGRVLPQHVQHPGFKLLPPHNIKIK